MNGAPVFMYHDLVKDPESIPAAHRPYVLTPEGFAAQMEALARIGRRGMSLSESLDLASQEPNRVVLTFDDGHASNCTDALPILRRHGFTATFFITAGWIGKSPYMSWDQIRTLAAAGMEIGSHSLSHRPPVTWTPADLDHELRESRRILEEGLGLPVLTGSSPTGFHHRGMPAAARAAGYRALCVSRIGLWRSRDDPFAIPRVPVKQNTGLPLFERLARGDGAPLRALRARQMLRNGLKRAMGVDLYLRLRRAALRARGGRP